MAFVMMAAQRMLQLDRIIESMKQAKSTSSLMIEVNSNIAIWGQTVLIAVLGVHLERRTILLSAV